MYMTVYQEIYNQYIQTWYPRNPRIEIFSIPNPGIIKFDRDWLSYLQYVWESILFEVLI